MSQCVFDGLSHFTSLLTATGHSYCYLYLVTPRDMFQSSRKKGQLADSSDQAMPFDVPDMKLIFSERWYPSVFFVFTFISFEMNEKFSSI